MAAALGDLPACRCAPWLTCIPMPIIALFWSRQLPGSPAAPRWCAVAPCLPVVLPAVWAAGGRIPARDRLLSLASCSSFWLLASVQAISRSTRDRLKLRLPSLLSAAVGPQDLLEPIGDRLLLKLLLTGTQREAPHGLFFLMNLPGEQSPSPLAEKSSAEAPISAV